MAEHINIVNDITPEARDCAQQMFTNNSKDASKETSNTLLRGSMSYTASACYYAAKTPLEAQAESEAKKNPKESNETQKLKPMGIPEFTTSGTTLTHLNKKKLDDQVDKVLKIHLNSISNVVDKDGIGWAMQNKGSDPFVVFTTGISMATSTVKTNQANAEWDTTHYLLVRNKTVLDGAFKKLNVHVLDCDSTKINQESSLYELRKHSDLLGSKSFDIERVLKQTSGKGFEIVFDTQTKRTDDRMRLTFDYEFISLDAYCKILDRTDPKQWFDDGALDNLNQDNGQMVANTELIDVSIRPLLYFDNKHTSTQGWIYARYADHVAIVAFRGASVMDNQDYLTERDSRLASLEGMDTNDYVLKRTDALAKHEGKKVHRGFRDAYNSVRESILESIYAVTNWSENWWVVFTGKSFGGSIAALGAYEFANRKVDDKGVKVAMMSYGSPRLANIEFVESYKQSVAVSYRFRYNQDPVCCFPRKMHNVPTLVTCDTNGLVTFTFPGPDPSKETKTIEDDEDDKLAGKLTIYEAVTIHIKYEITYMKVVTAGAKQGLE